MSGAGPRLAALSVADPPTVWEGLGFTVVDGTVRIGGIDVVLGAAGGAVGGVVGWSFEGLAPGADLDGLPTSAPPPASPETTHANGAVAVDHVVVLTPSHARTVGALASAGLDLRSTVERERGGRRVVQAFFLAGPTVVEVVGAPGAAQEGPATFFGIALVTDDLDATAAVLGPRLRPPKDAVQPGRRVADVDRSAGSTTPLLFMTPRPSRNPG